MNRKIRFWLDWVFLGIIALWALTLAVHSRREVAPDNVVRRSMLILSSPVLKTTRAVASRMSALFYSVLYGPVSYHEIQEYERQIRRLQIVVAHQNETIRRLLRLSRIETKSLHEDYRLVLAQVIGRGRDTYTEGLLISMGELDGLEVGLPVVHENATVVGYVREVNPTDSYIQLLSDPNSIVSCAIEFTNESGVVRGLGAQADHLEFLPRVQTSTLIEGARLVTSGLTGSLFPGGLRIGEIIRIEPNDAGERVGQVRPGVQYSSLEEVVVLLPRHGPIRPLNLRLDDDNGTETLTDVHRDDAVSTGAIDIPIPEDIAPPRPTPTPVANPTPITESEDRTLQPVDRQRPRPATLIVTPRTTPAQSDQAPEPPRAPQEDDTSADAPASAISSTPEQAREATATSPSLISGAEFLRTPDRIEPGRSTTGMTNAYPSPIIGAPRVSIQERGLNEDQNADQVRPPVIMLNDNARQPRQPEQEHIPSYPARYIFD